MKSEKKGSTMKNFCSNYSRLILFPIAILGFVLASGTSSLGADPFKEINGLIVIEAENYDSKTSTSSRGWYVIPSSSPTPTPDHDGDHSSGAGNGKYVEALPDTRVTHSDPLVNNVNFFSAGNNAPRMNYRVLVNSAGRYYVRARAYVTDTEGNSVHFGFDNIWPASGVAMQWCSTWNAWIWSGARRTEAQHCGVLNELYLDLSAGEHTIMVAMREDGAELDRFILTKDISYFPTGVGPAESPRTTGGVSPTNIAPAVNAGPDQAINTLTTNLDGSVSDDGLPEGILTSNWSKVSGPGSVTFQNASSPETAASFGAVGPYVLQLTANDGALSNSDKIGIDVKNTIVQPSGNQAPKVNAGPDQMININETAVLNGSASDDGIPDKTLTINWKMLYGPTTTVISNASNLQTAVSGFGAVGWYVFELSAHDGQLKGADKIGINVTNEAPNVSPSGQAFNQDAAGEGLVVMEAENHHGNVNYGTHGWVQMKQDGIQAMEAAPDAGYRIASNYVSGSPYLRFNVNFVKTGTHYLWLRGFCTGNDNSAHAGLDGKPSINSENITLAVKNGWVWSGNAGGGRATVYVNQTGLHTIEIWMREDGLVLDKVLLTTSMAYTPSGSGPQESVRE
jgi:hypothetical protein